MPLYMDVHHLDGPVTMEDVAKAHAADVEHQGSHDVNYLRYWVDEGQGKIFCLVEAPDAEAANTVHREAHGLVADDIFPVQEGS
jgi:peptidyl-tRNA hydrolase